MSAIVGIYHRDGASVDCTVLQRLTDTLAHRGPDGRGVEEMGPVGFGHLMLWTTPESLHEALPCVSGGFLITADARIDNREELLPALGLGEQPSEDISDSQVILAAYKKWGEDCPNHLLGDFAFAIWDAGRQTLFCSRDHFGVKPFYYYVSDGLFAFATERKALFSLPAVPCRLNERRLADYLVSLVEDTSSTFQEGILRLPPACTLTVRAQSFEQKSYWALDPSRQVSYATDEEYAAKFREIFTEAVRCRLRSALPVGSLLSGGLDSSSVTCVAAKLLRDQEKAPLATFSAVFDELRSCDEREYIDAVLNQQEGLHPAFLQADGINPLADLERIFWHMDEPHLGPNLSMIWDLYDMARRQGVRVLLDGHDGDSTVSHGSGWLRELAFGGRWLTLVREAAGASQIYSGSALALVWSYVRDCWLIPASTVNKPLRLFYRAVQRVARLCRTSGFRRASGERAADASGVRSGWKSLISEEFAARHSVTERFRKAQSTGNLGARTEREEHYRTLTYASHPLALEQFDALCGAHGIEQRFPFWDKRLVEFCLALPAEQKLHNGWSRIVMRRGMENILPGKVQWRRTKINFLPGFCLRLARLNQTRLDDLVERGPAMLSGCVRRDALRPMYNVIKLAQPVSWAPEVLPLWNVAVADAWLRQTEFCVPMEQCRDQQTERR